MAEPSVQHLFRQWRGGDAEAGKVMAQKFSDWYYAVTTVRVADRTGREPLERACQSFAQGIVTVTRPSSLVDWAHDLLEKELQTIGRGLEAGPSAGGDHPNALTKNESPTALIQAALGSLDPQQVQLLAHAYDSGTSIDALESLGETMGGLPFAMLDARYALKRALHTGAEIPFAVVPSESDMDRAPIGLYEAGRLASGDEVCTLEKWLLTDIDLCKDIAEFAAFVHAMRGGALAGHLAPAEQSPAPIDLPAPPAPEPPAPEPPAPESPAPEATAPEAPAPEDPPARDEVAEDDLLVDPDDLGMDIEPAQEDEEPEAVSAPPTSAPSASSPVSAAPSTMRTVLTIGAFALLAIGLLMVGALYLLRA